MTPKKDLLKILQAVKPGLASKGIIEQFTHFIFTGKEVMTYNDEVCVSHPLETSFQCSVVAEDLYKTITGMKGNPSIRMRMKEGKLLVQTSNREARLSTEVERDAEEMIKMLGLDKMEDQWTPLPKDFLKGLFLCMFAASKDMTTGVGTCVYVTNEMMLAADEARVSRYNFDKPTGMETLIPARSVADLINYDIKEGCLQENWAHFRTEDGVVFSARTMEDVYPVDRVVAPFDFEPGSTLDLPKELKQSVESVTFMAEGKLDLDKRVEVFVSGKNISCKAEKTVGEITDKIEFESNKEFSFYINPFFLSQVLEKTTTMAAGEDRAYFVSDKFEHLISLPVKQ